MGALHRSRDTGERLDHAIACLHFQGEAGVEREAAGCGGRPRGDYVCSLNCSQNIDVQGINIGKNHGVSRMSGFYHQTPLTSISGTVSVRGEPSRSEAGWQGD